METSSEYYFELIVRHFSGEASEKEEGLLSSWINESPENLTLFNEYGKTWNLVSEVKAESVINIDDEWKNLASKINFSSTDEINSKEFKIQYFGTSYKKSFTFLKVAASFALLIVSVYFLYHFIGVQGIKQLVAQNEAVEYVLPDSSHVTLNSGTIEYKKEFKNRKVNLNGEAFFDVVHNEKNPFNIETGNIIVEDIGTSFYVNTLSNGNKVTIILKQGKVALYKKDSPSEKYFLEPGEKIEYSISNKTFTKSINADNNYIAWKTRDIIFNDNTLTEIVLILNKVYHSNITLKEKEIGNCKLTAEFKNQPLESVLKILKETLHLTITKSGTGIEFSGNGCK